MTCRGHDQACTFAKTLLFGCNRNVRIAEMEHQVAPRPMSRERPAMDGFKQGLMPEMSAQSEVMST